MGWYIVVKTINGCRYRYRQRTWREGKHVLTESIYLGRDHGKPGRGTSKSTARTAGAQVGRIVPMLKGEQEFIASLFEPANQAPTWAPPWSRPYAAKRKSPVNAAAFKVAVAMGLIGTTRPWPGLDDGAWYQPATDRMQIPDATRFTNSSEFYLTFFHEIAHATKRRLKRTGRTRALAYEKRYGEEELVAELTAQLVTRLLGLSDGAIGMSARYLQGYLCYSEDPDAAQEWAEVEAGRAADYLVTLWLRVNTDE